jgi:hypothetical protein
MVSASPDASTNQPNTWLEQINQYTQAPTDLSDQLTSVSQLSDVKPTDWAFQALQSLVERYSVIAGYPDGIFWGNRVMTRYEFAAGLNAALDRVNELIATDKADLVRKEDLATLQRLQEEFAAELATLRSRVDALEARTAELEANQFSTTTKLNGEVIFAISDAFGDKKAIPSGTLLSSAGDLDIKTILSARVRLNFDTSFTGKDRLRTRLEANNTIPFGTSVTGTNMTRLVFDYLNPDGSNPDGSVLLGRLEYRFLLGSRTKVFLEAIGGDFDDTTNTYNPYLESAPLGSISRFGRFNPIYRLSNTGARVGSGIILAHDFSDQFSLSLGYLARRGENPQSKFGLFDGSYAALAQLNFQPRKNFGLGLTYVHFYYPGGQVITAGGTGSGFANAPFGTGVATSGNAYGLETSFSVSPKFTVSGWSGLTYATAEDSFGTVTRGDDAKIFNYAVTLAFPDLGKQGNLGAIIFGQPPKVSDNDFGSREDDDTSYHLEALYRYQLTDNIAITPGLLVIFNPEHNDNNDTIYVGTIRTTFRF